ncbi:unnamed protein product [Nezara viridula]|uniref:Ubiquitin-conjugating enzyme E2-18 kDa n=1 Tax=Nezara viridula TaxID=85310 RepID=A0A9P0HC09_NEZVI|nr:unnamed protein product [Nezara viridula]
MFRIELALAKMAAARRLQKEYAEVKTSSFRGFRNVSMEDGNILRWTGLLVPEFFPYNQAAFRVEILFPNEYPFKPPKITFGTKIYHPNIDEQGQVCLPLVTSENWKPATKAEQVIQALVALVNTPEPEHPLRADIAEEYIKDKKKFVRNALEHTKKFGEKRPEE